MITKITLAYNIKLVFGESEEVRSSPSHIGKDEMKASFIFIQKHPMASALHIEYSDGINKCYMFDTVEDYTNGIISIIKTGKNEKDTEKKAISKAKKEVMDELKAQLANE